MTKEKAIELSNQFKLLKTDKERWAWLMVNRSDAIRIELDNDYMGICFWYENKGDDEGLFCHFSSFIGRTQGAYDLIEFLGIKTVHDSPNFTEMTKT